MAKPDIADAVRDFLVKAEILLADMTFDRRNPDDPWDRLRRRLVESLAQHHIHAIVDPAEFRRRITE